MNLGHHRKLNRKLKRKKEPFESLSPSYNKIRLWKRRTMFSRTNFLQTKVESTDWNSQPVNRIGILSMSKRFDEIAKTFRCSKLWNEYFNLYWRRRRKVKDLITVLCTWQNIQYTYTVYDILYMYGLLA